MRLAVLIGVNLGPDQHRLPGTILWRRILHQHNHNTHMAKFTRLGLITGPVALIAAVVALGASLQVL